MAISPLEKRKTTAMQRTSFPMDGLGFKTKEPTAAPQKKSPTPAPAAPAQEAGAPKKPNKTTEEIIAGINANYKGPTAREKAAYANLQKNQQIDKDYNAKVALMPKPGVETYQAPLDQTVYKARTYSNPNAGEQTSALNRRFDVLRQKAEGNASLQQDQANSAIDRSAAARGRLGSGNVVKQRMLAQKELAGQREASINDIESQREVASADLGRQEADRRFAFDQEEAGRTFQAGEAANQRSFASQEAIKQRNMERDTIKKDNAFRDKTFSESKRQFRQQMDLAIQQFELDEDVTEFNKKIAEASKKGGNNYKLRNLSYGQQWGRALGINGAIEDNFGGQIKKSGLNI